jgi:hypothetical protein
MKTFASVKRFGLLDVAQRGMQQQAEGSGREEASSALIAPTIRGTCSRGFSINTDALLSI